MSTDQKTCFKCSVEKPLGDFYKHPQMADGHLNKCKTCTKSDARQARQRRLDYYRAYDRARGNRQTLEYRRAYRQGNPVKRHAQKAVRSALRTGKIARAESCKQCDAVGPLHGHHDDYAKPLEVRWLCPACHHSWHAQHGEGRSAA